MQRASDAILPSLCILYFQSAIVDDEVGERMEKSPRFRELSYFRGRVVLEKNAKKYSASERLEELYGDEVVRVYLHKSKLV